MKLLIITQIVDKNDSILGFFHRWIEGFAKQCAQVTVICLKKGENDLPKNVQVFSLGKEDGVSRLKYFARFYKYIWKYQKDYDLVFVHMNQEYVLMGFIFWKFLKKKIYMWRNHPNGSILTRFAILLSDRVFCTSPFSYTAYFKKTKIMPVGIDTDFFRKNENIQKKVNSIICVGRISPIKNPEILIDALGILRNRGVDISATFVGDFLNGVYEEKIKKHVKEKDLEKILNFHSPVSNDEIPSVMSSYDFCVNMTDLGSMDKTMFEAMSCELITISSNLALDGFIPEGLIFKDRDATSLAETIEKIVALDQGYRRNLGKVLRQYICENHSLTKLIDGLIDC